jgi:hypothetical protein
MALFKMRNVTTDELKNLILQSHRLSRKLIVQSDKIESLLNVAEVAKSELENYDVYLQFHPDFLLYSHENMNLDMDNLNKQFEDYCNYYDVHHIPSIMNYPKVLKNYSKDSDIIRFNNYPNDLKMIIIIADFNFWDLASQRYFIEFNHPSIQLIGHINNKFKFAAAHLSDKCYQTTNISLLE